VVTIWPVDTDLEPSRHFSLHCLPVPSARESLRGTGCYRDKYRPHCCAHLGGTRFEEISARNGLVGVIHLVPTEVGNLM
jgi:hypothetical protein